MKKIDGQMASVMKEIISSGESVVEIEGKEFYLSLIEKPETTVTDDVEANPELKKKLLLASINLNFNSRMHKLKNVSFFITNME